VRLTLVIVAAAALVGGIVGGAVGLGLGGSSGRSSVRSSTPSETAPSGSADSNQSAQQIYVAAAPAVVVITSSRATLGSGFMIDKRGNILTNEHVVRGSTRIRVGLSNGASYAARVVGTNPAQDVAVVHVDLPRSVLHPLDFDDSSSVAVGDTAYALGNPFGVEPSMSAGIVSATRRRTIETDAAVDRGSSGGPLLDRFGRVIGINDSVGVGFVVPGNTARRVASKLLRTGHNRGS
jgi:S1-C subfamily serine protease